MFLLYNSIGNFTCVKTALGMWAVPIFESRKDANKALAFVIRKFPDAYIKEVEEIKLK